MTGLEIRLAMVTDRLHRVSTASRSVGAALISRSASARSSPDENARPAPASTSTRICGVASTSRQSCSISQIICSFMALSISGRFRVASATSGRGQVTSTVEKCLIGVSLQRGAGRYRTARTAGGSGEGLDEGGHIRAAAEGWRVKQRPFIDTGPALRETRAALLWCASDGDRIDHLCGYGRG